MREELGTCYVSVLVSITVFLFKVVYISFVFYWLRFLITETDFQSSGLIFEYRYRFGFAGIIF